MNRFVLLYLSICLLYTAAFVWLVAPEVGVLEVRSNIEGVVSGEIGWVLLGLGLSYAVLTVPLNTWVLYQVSKKDISHFRLAIFAAAWVIAPGSIGMVFYFLTGSPYVALPFDGLMLLLTVYYYGVLTRLLAQRASVGIAL